MRYIICLIFTSNFINLVPLYNVFIMLRYLKSIIFISTILKLLEFIVGYFSADSLHLMDMCTMPMIMNHLLLLKQFILWNLLAI